MVKRAFCVAGVLILVALGLLFFPKSAEIVLEDREKGADTATKQWFPASARSEHFASFFQQGSSRVAGDISAREGTRPIEIDRPPVRVIEDPHAGFSAVAVDVARDEIVLQDENRHNIMIYNRLDSTPPSATMTEPKRIIGGPRTKVQFNCGVYVDPGNGDIYSLANDVMDTMVVFSREAKGDVPPDRELKTPHRTFGVVADEEAQELYLTLQHPPAVMVYHKMAQHDDAPIRILEGNHTQLAEPHGIAIDTKKQLLYAVNRGPVSYSKNGVGWARAIRDGERTWEPPQEKEAWRNMVPGSGKFLPPSITVYPLKASGDTQPLRVIQGSRTQLNWPAHISLDADHDELFVADPIVEAILVYRASDSGNVAPIRVIQGPRTGISRPHGVFVDRKNQEVVVANFGNHMATVYPRDASGDVAPSRTIRSAPQGTPAPMFGNVGALAYDTKRDEILAPN